MASLRDCARYVREEAADGIAWIAVWKVGRSWNVDTVWPEDLEYDQGVMVLEADYLERLREIMRADADAIKACHDADFWDEDMTWEEEREIHLGRNARSFGELAVIYCWEIVEKEVQ